jgi:hypothetical protein
MVAYVGACEHGHGSQPVDSLTFGVVLNEVSRIDTVMPEQQPQLVDARAVGDHVPMEPESPGGSVGRLQSEGEEACTLPSCYVFATNS